MDGKVVPTWNYELVHLHGTIEIHDDAAWKRQVVDDLTAHNERRASRPVRARHGRSMTRPAGFVDQQLKAIVGVEVHVTSVEAKRKLSQNKPESDRVGAADGLARVLRPP